MEKESSKKQQLDIYYDVSINLTECHQQTTDMEICDYYQSPVVFPFFKTYKGAMKAAKPWIEAGYTASIQCYKDDINEIEKILNQYTDRGCKEK